MNANPGPVTVIITCAIKPDKIEMARREVESVCSDLRDKHQ